MGFEALGCVMSLERWMSLYELIAWYLNGIQLEGENMILIKRAFGFLMDVCGFCLFNLNCIYLFSFEFFILNLNYILLQVD